MRSAPVLFLLLPAGAFGQGDTHTVAGAVLRGFRVQGVSISSGYFTSGSVAGIVAPMQNPLLGPTAVASGAVTIVRQASGEKGSFAFNYTPSYVTTLYSENGTSGHGSLNHTLGINWRRRLANKLAIVASANGLLSSFEQMYFAPGLLASVASVPTRFEDLAGAMLAGRHTDAQLAALLTRSPLQASPEQAFPYGSRILSASASVGLVWNRSSRTSLGVTASGNRSQSVRAAGVTGAAVAHSGPMLPQMTTASASISWSYSLSPRTQFGVQATSTRTLSSLQKGYASSGTASLGHTMSRRWFLQGRGGVGSLNYSQQQYSTPKSVQYLFGASLGFKTASHTVVAAYDRSLGDAYGLGSGTTGSASGGWSWARPGSAWTASAGSGYQQLHNAAFRGTISWRGHAGLTRLLGKSMQVNWQYVYLQLPHQSLRGQAQTQHGVLVSLAWMAPR
jgi:hypothetical protein